MQVINGTAPRMIQPSERLEAARRPSPKISNAADENIPTSIRNGSKGCNTG
jgi:hypothetical protein